MGHTDNYFLGGRLDSTTNDLIQHWYQHVSSFKRETLLPWIGLVQVAFKDFDLCQALQQSPAGSRARSHTIQVQANSVTQPAALNGAFDLIELVADSTRIHGTQGGNSFKRVIHTFSSMSTDDSWRQLGQVFIIDAIGLCQKCWIT